MQLRILICVNIPLQKTYLLLVSQLKLDDANGMVIKKHKIKLI